jgi:phosphatidylethanolamine-binding protein (PEBP) family uncharacterized protein
MAAPTNFQLLSRSFQHDGDIPKNFTCQGSDISPGLAWTQAPPKTQSFALTMEDPDASGGPFVHWLVYDLPARSVGIPEGLFTSVTVSIAVTEPYCFLLSGSIFLGITLLW